MDSFLNFIPLLHLPVDGEASPNLPHPSTSLPAEGLDSYNPFPNLPNFSSTKPSGGAGPKDGPKFKCDQRWSAASEFPANE